MAREVMYEDKSTAMIDSSSSTGGASGLICFTSSSSNPTNHHHEFSQIHQGFESNPSEIFNSNMDQIIGFSKHQASDDNDQSNSAMWIKSFFKNNNSNFNSSTTTTTTSSDHHHPNNNNNNNNLIDHHDTSATLLVDDSSLRCVFPCEGNERPSQGLSLSLSSNNPSSIGLQSFELRHHTTNIISHDHDHDQFIGSSSRNNGFMFGSKEQDGFMETSNFQGQQQQQFHLRNSKYLCPVQELLNEFCSLGSTISTHDKPKSQKSKQWEDDIDNNNMNIASSSSRNKSSLQSLEFGELQKRKTKLITMLEEVDRRYRHYCNQMKAVVSSFEAVAGNGAATVYSSLASKAMSRHFRSLRDGIISQIKETRAAMGEKDPIAPGTTKGETPRLRALDQALRQQRAFQQMSMMESHPWRPQRGLPERSVSVLRAWLFEHFLHPYPSDVDKHILARQTGLSRSQVSNWFINARVRLWKPMVEEMYLEETKDHENNYMTSTSDGLIDMDENRPFINPPTADQKPTPDQLIRIDSECLSSIINNPDKNNNDHSKSTKTLMQQCFGSFGSMDLDFSNSYNHGGVSNYADDQNFNAGSGSGGGVSLTLGLQQHGDNSGVSLAFSPASQSSLFYSRDHMEDCQPVQYSLLDGDQAQNLPYRNLMGAQLLHDLAG
ncbi:hypothetical protein ACFE04_018853 [Oxalis oulophora]